MNTKIQFTSIIRTLLTAVGSFLIGRTIFGEHIDDETLQTITGIVLTLFSTVWGILDKTATIEMVQSALRQVITFIGGFLIAAGKLTNNNLEAILAIIPTILPLIQSHFARVKSNQLNAGEITTQQLKK
jgi:hypothetical protein